METGSRALDSRAKRTADADMRVQIMKDFE